MFLVYQGVTLLDVGGPAEVFSEAARFGAAYVQHYVSPDGLPVATSTGARIAVDGAASGIRSADTVIIPGSDLLTSQPIDATLLEATQHLVDLNCRTVSICTGAFLLAGTGALNGRRATTHWQHARLLAGAYPQITVEPDALFVHDDRFHTSAGVSAGIDLALSLVESDHGADISRFVARRLVVHLQRRGGQSQFSASTDIPAPRTDPVRLARDAILESPAGTHTVNSLARAVNISPRHLTRLFTTELGLTPTRLIENHRLDVACNLLLNGTSVTETARRCGYSGTETLRRQFVARFGLSPASYRKHFTSTG